MKHFWENVNAIRKKLPTREEVADMDMPAEHRLILGVSRFLFEYVIKKHGLPSPEISLLDRVQNAHFYVTKASQRFDSGRSAGYVAYLKPHLDDHIKRSEQGGNAKWHEGDMIRVPSDNRGYYKVRNLLRGMSRRYGYTIDLEEALEFSDMGLSDEEVEEYEALHFEHVPFHNVSEIEDIVDEDPAIDPARQVVSVATIKSVLSLLTEREQSVVITNLIIGRGAGTRLAQGEGKSRQAFNLSKRKALAKLETTHVRELLYTED